MENQEFSDFHGRYCYGSVRYTVDQFERPKYPFQLQ